ncbi:hypothetical protein FO519_002219 [Halicephalobus sp. NKZ332]|nr:hypothetical protein FO519_002219 [Halicephalobus sp. NKZ332]
MKTFLLFLLVGVVGAAPGCITYPCAPEVAGADVVFLIDTSLSMGADNFAGIQNMLYTLAGDFKNFGSGNDNNRMAFITFSQDATTYGGLDAATSASAVNTTISKLTYDQFDLREITKALTSEESTMNLRSSAKKLLVAFISNPFTGTEPSANGLLDKVRGKYDALLAVGVGSKAIQFAYNDVTTISGTPQDAFFVTSKDQIDFVRLWIVTNACKNYHASTPAATTTPAVTQPTGLPDNCMLNTLNYDIYLVVDTSNQMSTDDFTALKQSVIDFVREYSVNDGKTQFGLVGVSVDPQRYYTGFHTGQTMSSLVNALNLITQEPSSGQAFDLALKVIDVAYLATYGSDSKTQLVIYFSGNTNFDTDPSSDVSSLKSKYNVNFVTVQYSSKADKDKLSKISGSGCTFDATDSAKRAALGFSLESLTCT